MKRQTTQASNENSQDTPMKNIYNSKRKLSVSNTDEKNERNSKLMKEVKSENSRKRYLCTYSRVFDKHPRTFTFSGSL